jgi:hypothetical protein
MGIEVAELAGKEYQLGKHTIEFNSDNLPKGTYFYTINAGDNSATNKMILLPE